MFRKAGLQLSVDGGLVSCLRIVVEKPLYPYYSACVDPVIKVIFVATMQSASIVINDYLHYKQLLSIGEISCGLAVFFLHDYS